MSFSPHIERFFVSDASSGVARLLICDDDESVLNQEGRLLRVVPVPIEKGENWIDVKFTVERHLALKVEAAGRKNLQLDSHGKIPSWPHEAAWIQQLNLGFPIPEFAAQTVGQ